jgi:hypothetical protein
VESLQELPITRFHRGLHAITSFQNRVFSNPLVS